MQPLLRGTVGATGALLVFAGGTVLVTNVVTKAAKAVITWRQKKTAIVCVRCDGDKRQRCFTCKGDGAFQWSPFENPVVERMCECPVCAGTGEQNCFNCLGSGSVQPL